MAASPRVSRAICARGPRRDQNRLLDCGGSRLTFAWSDTRWFFPPDTEEFDHTVEWSSVLFHLVWASDVWIITFDYLKAIFVLHFFIILALWRGIFSNTNHLGWSAVCPRPVMHRKRSFSPPRPRPQAWPHPPTAGADELLLRWSRKSENGKRRSKFSGWQTKVSTVEDVHKEESTWTP